MSTDPKITVSDRAGRRCASSGARWEPIMGYSRAVRSGNTVAVTGTVGVNADGTYPSSVGEQTRRSLVIIRAALEALGARLEHVIRTRMYLTGAEHWEQVARAHGEVFAAVRPAATAVIVAGLLDPAWLVEIEAEATLP